MDSYPFQGESSIEIKLIRLYSQTSSVLGLVWHLLNLRDNQTTVNYEVTLRKRVTVIFGALDNKWRSNDCLNWASYDLLMLLPLCHPRLQ